MTFIRIFHVFNAVMLVISSNQIWICWPCSAEFNEGRRHDDRIVEIIDQQRCEGWKPENYSSNHYWRNWQLKLDVQPLEITWKTLKFDCALQQCACVAANSREVLFSHRFNGHTRPTGNWWLQMPFDSFFFSSTKITQWTLKTPPLFTWSLNFNLMPIHWTFSWKDISWKSQWKCKNLSLSETIYVVLLVCSLSWRVCVRVFIAST